MRLDKRVAEIQDGVPEPKGRARGVHTFLLLVLGLAVAVVIPARAQQPAPDAPPAEAASEPAAAPSYDGEWWLMLDGQEQTGFVSGYQDCYISEYHGSVEFTKEVQSYADDVNKYFLADATRQKQTVSAALDAVRGAATDNPLPAYKAARPPPPDQPAYDGRFWIDADPATKLGFVEGYLACHEAKLKDADAKFSRPPAEYVDQINQAYGTAETTGDVDGKKAPVKIADVLHRLKDPETPPAKPAASPSLGGSARQ
jgi:hypothetical protein